MSSYIRRFWSYLGRNETAKGLFLVGVVLLGAIGIWAGIRVALGTEFPVLVVSSGSMCQRDSNPTVDKCTLAIGDLIVIRARDPSTIVASNVTTAGVEPNGSIIVFRPPALYSNNDPNFLVVHRVIAKRQTGQGYFFETRGDANGQPGACNCLNANDPWDAIGGIPAANVVGVFQYTVPIPYLGSTILAIRGFMYNDVKGQPRPEGLAVIVLLIAALFAFEIIEPSKRKSSSPDKQAPPKIEADSPIAGEGPDAPPGTG